MMKVGDKSEAESLEWKLNVSANDHHHGTSTKQTIQLQPESCSRVRRICTRLGGLFWDVLVIKVWGFFQKAWHLAKTEPKKVMHCLKVGVALSLVSIFYYMKPLYDGVEGNSMWAVMTVVVVYEYTAGAMLAKCVNRGVGTLLAGSLGVGVHWLASQSGEKIQPIIMQVSVFLLATAATFSRFIPSIKARFDYGCMIFILTFSLVSVSGYRVDKLLELASSRLSTIAIGATICILTSLLFCPVWAGHELHHLTTSNLRKLADSLDERFKYGGLGNAKEDALSEKSQAYKCVLNTKATEESLANFARWEPAHGNFSFRHPWKQYLKVGALMRACAYHLETLNGTINSKAEAPEFLKKHFREICNKVSSNCSNVLKESAIMMATMTKSSTIRLEVEDMNFSIDDLQKALKYLPNQSISTQRVTAAASCNDKEEPNKKPQMVPLMQIVPLVTAASLLIEIAARVKGIVQAIDELANQAEFEPENPSQSHKNGDGKDDVKMTTFQKV